MGDASARAGLLAASKSLSDAARNEPDPKAKAGLLKQAAELARAASKV